MLTGELRGCYGFDSGMLQIKFGDGLRLGAGLTKERIRMGKVDELVN